MVVCQHPCLSELLNGGGVRIRTSGDERFMKLDGNRQLVLVAREQLVAPLKPKPVYTPVAEDSGPPVDMRTKEGRALKSAGAKAAAAVGAG